MTTELPYDRKERWSGNPRHRIKSSRLTDENLRDLQDNDSRVANSVGEAHVHFNSNQIKRDIGYRRRLRESLEAEEARTGRSPVKGWKP